MRNEKKHNSLWERFIVERSLKYSGRKHNFVSSWRKVGVNVRWRHQPTVSKSHNTPVSCAHNCRDIAALGKAQIPLCRLPRDVRDKPVTSPLARILLRRLPRKFPVRGSFGEVGVMECGLKGTSRVCRGLVADVTGKSAWWNLGLTLTESWDT